jgi:hypothetical protein
MKKILSISYSLLFTLPLIAQDSTFSVFDNGKMWTFDYPPIEYFEKTYGFKPSIGWFDSVRMSALRFSNYCSASFVSPKGLVMTNHHCARQSITAVQQKGEDLNKNGFYAKTYKEERKVPGLFVDQLVKIQDITDAVNALISKIKKPISQSILDSLTEKIKKDFKEKSEWKNLEIQVISFHKGVQYSIYGFKRYNDVRLVFAPELQLGYFGGDYDNFTYPRYALDCAFFRVYENNKPLKTNFYFKFNLNGIRENEPVFVIGNPGRTERLHTLQQLKFSELHQLPLTLNFIENRIQILNKFIKENKNDSIQNRIFSLENSKKALSGMLNGLKDPQIIKRKTAFEKYLQLNCPEDKKHIWNKIDSIKQEFAKYYYTFFIFLPRDLSPSGLEIIKDCYDFYSIDSLGKDSLKYKNLRKKIENFQPTKYLSLEKDLFEILFKEIKTHEKQINKAKDLLEFENKIYDILQSKIYQNDYIKNIALNKKISADTTDALIKFGTLIYQLYKEAKDKIEELQFKENLLNAEIAKIQFKLFGNNIPPDANFNLRIADGIVKGYAYNGTIAPYMTTYFGLYDRYYSNPNYKDWTLPQKWINPPKKLLPIPLNFVSTNDIIGGNSGSAIINRNKEAVGLIFDGNIESLPGRYIYLDSLNRAISVHCAGIYAALKYIYKSKRLYLELQ